MGSKLLDALLKLSIIASVLFASASVGYYFLVYLPQRDAQVDAARTKEKAEADAARAQEKAEAEAAQAKEKAEAEAAREHEKALAEEAKHDQQERRDKEQAEAQAKYQDCLYRANSNYRAAWASNCSQVARDDPKEHASCIAIGLDKQTCDAMYSHDASPNCALPSRLADSLEATLKESRDRCLQASKAGLL